MAQVQVDLRGLQADQQELRGFVMNGYNFTERVRKALAFAREEAAMLGHDYTDTEHELLGLIRDGDNLAMTVVAGLGVEPSALRAAVLAAVKPGATPGHLSQDLPYTGRAKKVLEYAMTEARDLDHDYVGTEHLLLGLLRVEAGVAAQVLRTAGLTLETTRDAVIRVLGSGGSGPAVEGKASIVSRRPQHTAMLDPLGGLSQPIKAVVASALEIAKADKRPRPDRTDLLAALVLSSREIAAAFAARDIDVVAFLAELRALEDDR
jgi:hypothetical protein